MLVFHVIIAGILLSRWQCYAVATVASLLVAFLAWAEWAHVIGHYTLLILPSEAQAHGTLEQAPFGDMYATAAVAFLAATLFLVAHFVTTLAERALR